MILLCLTDLESVLQCVPLLTVCTTLCTLVSVSLCSAGHLRFLDPSTAVVLVLRAACALWHTITLMLRCCITYRMLMLRVEALTPDLRDWGSLLGPLGTRISPWLAG
jgi:hypothetical protein